MGDFNAYAGRILRVDLTNEKITEEKLDEATARKYVGGTGIGAKYLFDEVPAGVEWSDPANRIIIASGPLGGGWVGGSGTFSVVTKGALTNGAVATQANGFFGAYLRFADYDGIILQGKAKRWLYLYIERGKAELRDAVHLVGKDTWETPDQIKSDLGKGEREMSVASIGVAGENLVKFAAIFGDKGHVASHNGVGAVMGSKKLKAIAIARSQTRPAVQNREELSTMGKKLLESTANDPRNNQTYTWGTLTGVVRSATAKDGVLPVKNYSTSVYEIAPEKLEKYGGPYIRSHFEPKPAPCWGCQFHHCHMLKITEEPYKGYVSEEPEYEGFAAFGPVIGVTDVTATIFLTNEADKFGVDINEAGWALGLAIECYEKGVLTRKDTGGLELKWGNHEAIYRLLQQVARREGLGNVLAEGTMRAAQQIGGDAPKFAIHTMKGNTPRGHDHRSRWPMLFDTCVSQMSTDEGYSMAKPADLGLSVTPGLGHNNSLEDTVAWNAACKGAAQFEDCLGICRFTTRTDLKLLAEAVSSATGWDFSAAEALTVGKRIVNLLRAFNMRHGHTAEMDAPSPRYGSTPVDGPSQGKSIMPHWNEMRRRYYEAMGWDGKTGKPLPDTLKQLGLEPAIPELWGT